MNHSRPKNLNLFTICFPLPAIVSIGHRLSGVFLFLLIPVLLWGLSLSFTPQGFDQLQTWFGLRGVKILIWLLFIPFCYHFVAGIRHLLMDIHVGTTLKGGRTAAMMTFIISFIIIILAGVWLW